MYHLLALSTRIYTRFGQFAMVVARLLPEFFSPLISYFLREISKPEARTLHP